MRALRDAGAMSGSRLKRHTAGGFNTVYKLGDDASDSVVRKVINPRLAHDPSTLIESPSR
jgi:hypothetical protein